MLTELSGWAIAAVAVLGVLAVAGGIAVFVVDSMARATFALLGSFLAVAGMLLAFDLTYLAVITALMMTMVHNARGSAVAGVAAFVLLAVGIWTVDWPIGRTQRPEDSTRQLGEAIMGSHMLVMLVIGIALFGTILAGTVLATARGRYDRFGADLAAKRPDDPVPGGLPR